MAIWLLIESKANRKALEQREARYQVESAKRVADAAEACAKREADMTKRIRELEESRMKELRTANEQYLTAMQALVTSLQDFAGQNNELHRSVRHLYNFLRTNCAKAAPPPPGGEGSDAYYAPAAAIPDLTPGAAQQAQIPAKRRSSAEIRIPDQGEAK
jgi:methyl-accepting chemotaxis protein